MEEKFTCPLCGKKYDTPEEMAECILRCSAENHKRKERERAEKLTKEKATRKKVILDLNEQLKTLVRKYQEDYNDPFIIDGIRFVNDKNIFEAIVEDLFI